MIRRGHYSSNNFQDSTKRKTTEKKTLGYLLRVLFFNAFEVGTESGNQVFSNESLRSIVSSRAPLPTLGTLEASEDDSTKNMLRFWHRYIRNIHKFLLFSNKSFLLLKFKRREN
jgi:hypothetical protein